ncbi:hypothetical protein AC579_9988 [Pseudocercospora musae]|uniref:Uncharacterized protein n=1 Tax=Pseudocercospora musae TaxID=113226 RepID=A0A139I4L0_9PEZI|nr:hypothetical protein AC579_9988 [Pseudocercospora musae]
MSRHTVQVFVPVYPGYENGAEMGDGIVRPANKTLRWKDITFIKLDGIEGIPVQITFRFLPTTILKVQK